jgi:hypothetical protein
VGASEAAVEALTPRGAVCHIRPHAGPGTPHFADAPAALTDALTRIDLGTGSTADLHGALAAARDRDSLGLWHLMVATDDGHARAALMDRLIAIEPLPAGVDCRDVLGRQADALRRWRAEFSWSPP